MYAHDTGEKVAAKAGSVWCSIVYVSILYYIIDSILNLFYYIIL